MHVVSRNKRKTFRIFNNEDSTFRTHLRPCSKRTGMFVFKSGTYSDPYDYFKIISKALADGTYKFKIKSQDDLENLSPGVETSVTIEGYLLPPKSVSGSMSGNTVTLTWSHSNSGAPDNYKVYGNGGSGSIIDRTSVLKTVSGSVLSTSFSVANGDWDFVVEAVSGSRESVNHNIVELTAPSTSEKPKPPGFGGRNKVTGLSLKRESVGKVIIRFLWLYGSEASSFNVYHDDGTGTIDYTSANYNFSRASTFIQEYTTPQLHTDDQNKTYKFVVRSVSADGVEDDNTDEYTVEVDGVAPDNASVISATSVF